jgi:hypothetical protein
VSWLAFLLVVQSKLWVNFYTTEKGKNMENQLTVARLIELLQALPNQDALVEMAMNQEYQNDVCESDIHVWADNLVVIGE